MGNGTMIDFHWTAITYIRRLIKSAAPFLFEILTGLVAGWTGCTFDAAENDFTTGICFLVGLNKLNCILGVNPLYYSYGIADYFLRLLANFELCFNKESNILETIIVIFD